MRGWFGGTPRRCPVCHPCSPTAVWAAPGPPEAVQPALLGPEQVTAPADVQAAIDRLIAAVAATGEVFDANVLRSQMHAAGGSGTIFGARLRAAQRRGLIRATGYTASTSPDTHGKPIRQWVGTGSTWPAGALPDQPRGRV